MDDCILLQTDLFKFVKWCETVGLSLNLDKCKTMTFFRMRTSIIHNYLIYNQTLCLVNQVDDLWFILVPSLSFIITLNTFHVKLYVLRVSFTVICQFLTKPLFYSNIYFISKINPGILLVVWSPYIRKT